MRKIDGDALKALITSWIERTTHGEQTILSESIRETLRGVIEYINTLPTQKDTPLPHAEWNDAFGDAQYAKCSRCGELYEVSDCANPSKELLEAFGKFYKFCPNCGAKMDKEVSADDA